MVKIMMLTVFMLILSVGKMFAQTDAKAKAILAETSKKYKSFNIVKADFTYTIISQQADINETGNGSLYAKSKENKYKVQLKDQDLISDGKSQWTYLKEDKEVQLSDVDNKPNALNPAKLFTIYEKGYKYIYNGNVKSNGKSYYSIDLTPTDSKQSFFKVRLSIDKVSKLMRKAEIFDKNGSRYTYTITAFTPNVKVLETVFAFDAKKNPGVEVVDLR